MAGLIDYREPSNPYDRNAIRVTNVYGQQIGHLPRQVVQRLAAYVDDGSLVIDARLSGSSGQFDVPIEIKLFGPIDDARKSQISARLKKDKIPTAHLDQAELRREMQRQQDLARASAIASTMQNGMSAPGYGAGPSQHAYRRLEDIIAENGRELNPREIGECSEKFGMSEEDLAQLPKADKPKRILTELLPYQRQGLAWLQDRENPKLPERGSADPVQLWKRDSKNVFENIATRLRMKEEPKLASGGILADDMGLGKTIQIISLIVWDQEKLNAEDSRTTLVVAPLSLLSNWSGQIAQHVNPKKPLRVFTYHGNGKSKCNNPKDFARYDVVLTTYGTVKAEYDIKSTKDQEDFVRKTGIFSNTWRRIVLDEGHTIRNPTTRTTKSVCAIKASSRWCLTGTPIVNSLTDLCSILSFIGVTGGLEQLPVFNSVLTNPVKQRSSTAISLLQAVMAQFTLRRKKGFEFVNLKLPSIIHRVIDIEFNEKERKIHDAFNSTAKSDFQQWQELRHGDAHDRRQARERYNHLFEVLLRLRQVCNHWKLCHKRVTELMDILAEMKSVDLTPENVDALKDLMKLAVEASDDCPICMDTITIRKYPMITTCGHIFCKDDILQVIQTQGKCPMCRHELKTEKDVVELTASDYDKEDKLVEPKTEDDEEQEDGESSKLKALLELLQSKQDEENPKIVLFSQWTSFLTLLEPHLRGVGIKFTRLDGTMTVSQRDAALKAFDDDPDCSILLASLAVASVGLNLVVANTVIMCDSWWAPSIEDQAVDRIHRLGQKRDCTVFKLVVKDSIEQRVLGIQEDKRALMRAAFNEGGDANPHHRSENRVRDLQRLLE